MALPLTFVTGASGHVGANLVRALLARGAERVRVLLRPDSDNRAVDGLDVERVYGDLRDSDDALRAFVRGCTYGYHAAAFVSIRFGDRKNLFDVNIEGSKRLMRACLDEHVKRVVYTSSFGAIRNVAPDVSDEESTFSPYELTTDYEMAKGFAELEVLRMIPRGLDVVTVNPSGIVGPYDFRPALLGSTVVDASTGKMKAYVPGAFNMVPMKDVVAGHLLAMEKGRTGERYLLCGEEVTIDKMLDYISEFSGYPRPRICIPAKLLLPVSRIKDALQRTFAPNAKPRFTYGSIHLLNSGKRGSNAKAVRELGLQPTPIRDAFKDAIEWFMANGYIPRRSRL